MSKSLLHAYNNDVLVVLYLIFVISCDGYYFWRVEIGVLEPMTKLSKL